MGIASAEVERRTSLVCTEALSFVNILVFLKKKNKRIILKPPDGFSYKFQILEINRLFRYYR